VLVDVKNVVANDAERKPVVVNVGVVRVKTNRE
jgi:hypothetical protein